MTLQTELARLKELEAKATSPNWKFNRIDHDDGSMSYERECGNRDFMAIYDRNYDQPMRAKFDADLIAAMRNALTKLLDTIDILHGALACNESFHRLGGIDDCEPCKAKKEVQALWKE